MMKKSKMVRSVGFALAILFYLTILMLPRNAAAKSKVVAIEGLSYSVNASMVDNLRSFIGRKIYVTTDSGESFAGFVKEVGNHLSGWLPA